MVATEVKNHGRPVYDLYVYRPRTPTPVVTGGGGFGYINPHGDLCCIRFFKGDALMFEDNVPMIVASGARATYTAYQESLQTWQNKATFARDELKRRGFGMDPDDWDRAEVNGKSFPRTRDEDAEAPKVKPSFANFRPVR